MLEVRKYPKTELSELLGTKSKQGIDNKLTTYGVKFSSCGRGDNRVYNIEEISDPFKVYCILKIGIPAQQNFDNIRILYYQLLNDEEFLKLPLTVKEEYMDSLNHHISRQSISKCIEYLEKAEYIHSDNSDCTYFSITKDRNGKRAAKEISKEMYLEGWKKYWNSKTYGDSDYAYFNMYSYVGGHPCKVPKTIQNGIYGDEIAKLTELVNQAYLNRTFNE